LNTDCSDYQELKACLFVVNYKGYPLDKTLGSYLVELIWKYSLKRVRKYAFATIKNKLNIESRLVLILCK